MSFSSPRPAVLVGAAFVGAAAVLGTVSLGLAVSAPHSAGGPVAVPAVSALVRILPDCESDAASVPDVECVTFDGSPQRWFVYTFRNGTLVAERPLTAAPVPAAGRSASDGPFWSVTGS